MGLAGALSPPNLALRANRVSWTKSGLEAVKKSQPPINADERRLKTKVLSVLICVYRRLVMNFSHLLTVVAQKRTVDLAALDELRA
jgi:hypothetical protein